MCRIIQVKAQILGNKITKQEEIKVSYIKVNVESFTKLKYIICIPRSVDFPAKFWNQMNKTFNLAHRNDQGTSAPTVGRPQDLIYAKLWYRIMKRCKPFNICHWMGEAAIVFRMDLTNFETCETLSACEIKEKTSMNSPLRGCSMPSSSADSHASTVSN
jgi:hypothetical protein